MLLENTKEKKPAFVKLLTVPLSVWEKRSIEMCQFLDDVKEGSVIPLTEHETWFVLLIAAEEWETTSARR